MLHVVRLSRLAGVLAVAVLAGVPAAAAFAQTSSARIIETPGADLATPMSAVERETLGRLFVERWGGYVQRVHAVPAEVWAERMGSSFAAADPANLRSALLRDTFEGAMAELIGAGRKVRDEQVTELFARQAAAGRASPAEAAALSTKVLGSTTGDLVFTAVTPCRIVDTRVAGGPIAANSSRSFLGVAVNAGSNFTSQGGSATPCGVAAIGASAIMLNVTAVAPSAAGFATVYKSGDTRPLASSLNYVAGDIVNNSVVVGIPNPLAITDFIIYTFAQSHYVVDIIGYFAPPQATELQCIDTAIVVTNIAAGASTFINNPNCPSGYSASVPYCFANSSAVYLKGMGFNSNTPGLATFCAWTNTSTVTQQVLGGNVCCRIPGR